ncbi:MAG: HEAT repeat domain-containing protein, partial [Candidatus Hydrogenedentes bacterium]|nr:HEAT repeat domain-containing protein [Candidatus Hydrogenedentota bacterium]
YLYDTALNAISVVRGSTATETLATALPTFSSALQARAIGALALRGDPAALPAIHLASEQSDPALRGASIRALGNLADGTSTSILLAFAAGPKAEERALARASLLTMTGPGVNDALVTAAMGSNNSVRTEAVRMIVARKVRVGIPVLLRMAQRDIESLQIEALRGLGTIATADDLPALVDVLIEAPRLTVRAEAARAIVSTAVRADRGLDRTFAIRRALQHGVQSLETRVLLIEMLGEIGDDRGLPAIRAVVKRPNPLVADAAIRVLSAWPTSAPLDDLESLVKRVDGPNLRRRAVDGYLQLLRKPSARSLEETLKRYKWAIRIATTSEQRATILSDLQQLPGEAAQELIGTLTADRG